MTEAARVTRDSAFQRAANMLAWLGSRSAPLVAVVVLLAAWVGTSHYVGGLVFPGPLEVLERIVGFWRADILLEPLGKTALRSLLGFALALVVGTAYGIAVARSERMAEYTSLLFRVTLFTPTLVIIFVGVLMLGRGNLYSIVLISAFIAFANIGVYMRDALQDIDADVLAMADAFKASRRSRIRHVYVPALTPALLGASRVGFSLASKGVILAEVFGFPGGIGFRIQNAFSAYDVSGMLAWLMVAVVALLVFEQGMRLIEWRFVPWR